MVNLTEETNFRAPFRRC